MIISDYANGYVVKEYLEPIVSGDSGFSYDCVQNRSDLRNMDKLLDYIKLSYFRIRKDNSKVLDFGLC